MGDAKREQSGYLAQCSIGMGLFLAWTAGDVHTKAVAGISGSNLAHLVDIIAGIGCNILVLAVVVLAHKRIRSIAHRRELCAAAGIATVAGPVTATLSCSALPSLPLLAAGAMMRGASTALMFLAWSELISKMPFRQASICYAAAYAESVMLQLIMGVMPPAMAMAIALACGAASAVLLLLATKNPLGSSDPQPLDKHAREWTLPWRPLLLTATYTLVTFTFMHLLGNGSSETIGRLGGGAAALICAIGCALFFDKRFDATSLGAAALPLAVAALLLWCLAGEKSAVLVMALADAGNVAFRIFVLSMLGNISYRYGVPALWLFGIVRIAMMGAEGCGLLLSMEAMTTAGTATIANPVCYAMILTLVLICTSAQDVRRISETSWNILGKEEGSGNEGKASQLEAVMSKQELILWQCAGVARTYGLTHREEEILSYLAAGMTRAEIASKLVLSQSTVSTHTKHLYAKLSVHSKDEALAVLDAQGR